MRGQIVTRPGKVGSTVRHRCFTPVAAPTADESDNGNFRSYPRVHHLDNFPWTLRSVASDLLKTIQAFDWSI